MKRMKTVALVAHDNMKRDLAEWVDWNTMKLREHRLICTGTTGKMVEKTLLEHKEEMSECVKHGECVSDIRLQDFNLNIIKLKSGPLGGDQQLGSLIADGQIDALIFFWDPMSAQPHDVDVKALLRLATLYNVPTAVNRSSADYLISSPLFDTDEYEPDVKDYSAYVERVLQ
ncbi:MAG: methylglyoxal synthase [Alistipes sp.]|nr:methylglyoxal synthase [Alistipes sp.]